MAAKKKKSAAKVARRSSSNKGIIYHSHPAYGYIAVGFIFLVLVLLLSGMK